MRMSRLRFGSILEWVLAAACVFLVVGAIGFLGSEIQTFKGVTPVLAGGPSSPEPPAALPPRAVSVPMLLLNGGDEIHVGERAATVAAKVSATWQAGVEALERGVYGDRITRSYDDGARRFVLVLEPAAAGTDSRVAAIYLQPR